MMLTKIIPLVAVIAITSCSSPISVKKIDPEVPASLAENPAPKEAGLLMDRIALAQSRLDPKRPETLQSYNYLVARLIDELVKTDYDISDKAFDLRGSGKSYRLTIEEPADLRGIAQTVIPVDGLRFAGEFAVEVNEVTSGLGAPVISREKDITKARSGNSFLIPYRPLTAIVDARRNPQVLRFIDPYTQQSVSLSGKTMELAADFNAAVSYGLSETRVDKLGIVRMLNPSRYDATIKLDFLQPYDPDRIPVLMTHGLQSTPATWLAMYLELIEDPEIRENYQFWSFSYPSGYPFPHSAALLREQLDAVDKAFPGHKDIVLIGHSMGTLISRLMISEGGEELWNTFFRQSPDEITLDRKSRRLVLDMLQFESRPNIQRAIFYSGPHQGSELATSWIGRLGAKLIRLPATFADVRNSLVNIITVDTTALKMDRMPSSIDTLAPNNRMVKAMAKLPRRPDVPVHSIMGDRGKGDTPDSSDGIVAYWSAHLPNQASEKIVPSGHGSHEHPEGIAEAKRILRENIGLKGE